MLKAFAALDEPQPGVAWRERFRAHWPETRSWYLKQGLAARPTVAEAQFALEHHMPELMPIYRRLCSLAGEDDVACRWLSCWNSPPLFDGCSVAVWLGDGGPALMRNYDFELNLTAGRIERSCWLGRSVIAMTGGLRGPWGALDGMNQDGLAAALTFGGGSTHGRGFAMALVLRYVLETCRTAGEAVSALIRIPVGMSQNAVIVDRTGAHATVFLNPDRAARVSDELVCTNHQDGTVSPGWEAQTQTLARQRHLATRLAAARNGVPELVDALLAPPLYRRLRPGGFGTVYTAAYRPLEGACEYRWPGKTWRQAFNRFEPGVYSHDYAAAT